MREKDVKKKRKQLFGKKFNSQKKLPKNKFPKNSYNFNHKHLRMTLYLCFYNELDFLSK